VKNVPKALNTREIRSERVARKRVEKSSSIRLARASEIVRQNVTTLSEGYIRVYRVPIYCKINFDATRLQFDYVDGRGRYIHYIQAEKNTVTPDLESKEVTKPVVLLRRLQASTKNDPLDSSKNIQVTVVIWPGRCYFPATLFVSCFGFEGESDLL
jgi:hypothetical protein